MGETRRMSTDDLIARLAELSTDKDPLLAMSTRHAEYMAAYLRIYERHARAGDGTAVLRLNANEMGVLADWLDELAARRHKAHRGEDDG